MEGPRYKIKAKATHAKMTAFLNDRKPSTPFFHRFRRFRTMSRVSCLAMFEEGLGRAGEKPRLQEIRSKLNLSCLISCSHDWLHGSQGSGTNVALFAQPVGVNRFHKEPGFGAAAGDEWHPWNGSRNMEQECITGLMSRIWTLARKFLWGMMIYQ